MIPRRWVIALSRARDQPIFSPTRLVRIRQLLVVRDSVWGLRAVGVSTKGSCSIFPSSFIFCCKRRFGDTIKSSSTLETMQDLATCDFYENF
jgi:hypothetical protein